MAAGGAELILQRLRLYASKRPAAVAVNPDWTISVEQQPFQRPMAGAAGSTAGSELPAGVNVAAGIAATIEGHGTRFRVASHPPQDPRHDAKRYWRGPVWLVVNYMIADGLARAGQDDAAARITASSLDLIRDNGFAEYYDPITGEPLGGGRFTWTAAMVLEFMSMEG
jgi:hypothetical protein